jgi:hypothetical protein
MLVSGTTFWCRENTYIWCAKNAFEPQKFIFSKGNTILKLETLS